MKTKKKQGRKTGKEKRGDLVPAGPTSPMALTGPTSDDSAVATHALAVTFDLDQAARMIQERIAELVYPPEFDIETTALIGPNCKYGPLLHARLCRFTMLGMKPARAAKLAGITPETLSNWRNLFPKLDADLNEAAQLVNAYAMMLFQRFMSRDDELGLRALIKYLESHCEEFRTKQQVEVGAAHRPEDVVKSIRQNVYGIIDDAKAREVDDARNGRDMRLPKDATQEPLEGLGCVDIDSEQRGAPTADIRIRAALLMNYGDGDAAIVALPQDAAAADAAEIDFSFI